MSKASAEETAQSVRVIVGVQILELDAVQSLKAMCASFRVHPHSSVNTTSREIRGTWQLAAAVDEIV